jgi:hypothetical protein
MSNQVTSETSTKEMAQQRGERPIRHELFNDAAAALRRPGVGATVAGVTVLAAGAIWGVTEALVASAAAYAVFRRLKKNARRAE